MPTKEWNYKHGWATEFEIPINSHPSWGGKLWRTHIFTRTKKQAKEILRTRYEPEYKGKATILGYKRY